MNANFKALGMDATLQNYSIYPSLNDIIKTMGGWTTVGQPDRTA